MTFPFVFFFSTTQYLILCQTFSGIDVSCKCFCLLYFFSSITQYLTQCQTFSSVDVQLQMFLLFVFFFPFNLAFFSPLINGSMATSTDGYYIAKQCQCSALYFYIYAPRTLTCSLNIFQEFLLKKKKGQVIGQPSWVGLAHKRRGRLRVGPFFYFGQKICVWVGLENFYPFFHVSYCWLSWVLGKIFCEY